MPQCKKCFKNYENSILAVTCHCSDRRVVRLGDGSQPGVIAAITRYRCYRCAKEHDELSSAQACVEQHEETEYQLNLKFLKESQSFFLNMHDSVANVKPYQFGVDSYAVIMLTQGERKSIVVDQPQLLQWLASQTIHWRDKKNQEKSRQEWISLEGYLIESELRIKMEKAETVHQQIRELERTLKKLEEEGDALRAKHAALKHFK